MKMTMRIGPTKKALVVAAWAGWVWAATVAWGQQVVIDMENTLVSLSENTAGQDYVLMANNPGAAFTVIGINLSIQIGNGDATASAPIITAVDAVTGTPFSSLPAGNRLLNMTEVTEQFFNVDLGVNLGTAPSATVTIPSGAFRLATITFDTTSLGAGTWSLNVGGVNPIYGADTSFTLASGYAELNPQISLADGNLSVVPEWEGSGVAAGLLLVGWAIRRSTSGR